MQMVLSNDMTKSCTRIRSSWTESPTNTSDIFLLRRGGHHLGVKGLRSSIEQLDNIATFKTINVLFLTLPPSFYLDLSQNSEALQLDPWEMSAKSMTGPDAMAAIGHRHVFRYIELWTSKVSCANMRRGGASGLCSCSIISYGSEQHMFLTSLRKPVKFTWQAYLWPWHQS